MSNRLSETEAWLRRMRDGRPEALAAMFDHYRQRLRQMVQLRMDGRLAARIDPSDVLQEVYLDARRQVQSYLRDPKVAVYVWLRGLAQQRLSNLHRDHLRTQRRSLLNEMSLPTESTANLAGRLLARVDTPSRVLLKAELGQRLHRALAGLESDDRDVILMRHFENMSNGEVAEVLGLSDSGATMRYGRALTRLKALLLEHLSSGESRP